MASHGNKAIEDSGHPPQRFPQLGIVTNTRLVIKATWPNAHLAVVEAVGGVLAERREALGLTRYALSQRTGVSQQAISYYERGHRRPTLERLACLAEGLELSLSELIALAERAAR